MAIISGRIQFGDYKLNKISKFIKMAGNYESIVSEIINFDESGVINSPEVHSTPNVGVDDKNILKS